MATELSYVRMKLSNEAKLAEENKIEQRKKSLIVLILDFLETYGYVNAVERLQTESNIFLNKVAPADNVDLMMILQEYETYYTIKYGKKPKFIKKNTEPLNLGPTKRRDTNKSSHSSSHRVGSSLPKKEKKTTSSSNTTNNKYLTKKVLTPESSSATLVDDNDCFGGIVGTSVKNDKKKSNSNNKSTTNDINNENTSIQVNKMFHNNIPYPEDPGVCKLLKPLPNYGNDYYELASIISRDIYVSNPDVKWDDIAGLEDSKRLVKEAVVLPIKYPELFTGILQPWKGLLLFGPPGTGKTMLAKAVATECRTTFFNISASSIVSKWRGDSEKLVRVLFELAKYHAPSTIFLDELEAIMSQRTSDGAEHEGSRRMKTELLVQLDGLSKNSEHIFLLAASNLPWDLDTAMLRRLEKKNFKARKRMFEINLPNGSVDSNNNIVVEGLDYDKLAELTEGYSGSDIKLVCKEAAMIPVRKIFNILEQMNEKDTEELARNNHPENENEGEGSHINISGLKREPVRMKDVFKALECTKPSCPTTLSEKYLEWQNNFGSY
jgi:katanin p60 ATPase-containing subunit A1